MGSTVGTALAGAGIGIATAGIPTFGYGAGKRTGY